MTSVIEKLYRLDNKVIIITGGAGLLGARYTRLLAEAGARVVVADIDLARAQSLAQSIDRCGLPAVFPLAVDVTDEKSVRSMAEEVATKYGRIDCLVNNAAIDPKFAPSVAGNTSAFEDFSLAVWNRELAVNITGPFLCCQAVTNQMFRRKQGGVIVNIGSIYGLVGPDQRIYPAGSFKPVTYSVSKAAILGLTKYLAAYWAGKGIRVNALTLGGIEAGHDETFLAAYSARTPMGRMAQPEEAANSLLFLLSDASSYMTGSNLIVDGGWTAW